MPEQSLITNPTDINLKRDDDVQQIFGRPPGYFLRWGITLLFFFFITLVGMAFFVEYPDTVVAPVQITTENPPVAVVARVSGKISELKVENDETITKGQLIAELENTANRTDILLLEQEVEKAVKEGNRYRFLDMKFVAGWQVGNLKTSYAAFLQHQQDLKFYLEERHASKQQRALRKQINELFNLNASLEKQRIPLQGIISLATQKLNRYRKLQENGDANLEQLEQVQTELLMAENNLSQISNQISRNGLEIAKIETQMLSLDQGDDVGSNTRWQQVKTDLQQLQREIQEWKQNYLLIAPIDGQISMPQPLTEQQFVKAGEKLLTIVPLGGAGEMIAEAQLPIANSGKVTELDSVNIRLNGFPYQEFGIIRGAVTEIAAIPNADGTAYLVEIELPNGLATTYDRTLDFRQKMQGEAHIVTKKRRIAERIFDPIMSALYNRP